MKTLSTIMSLLCLLSASIFAFAGIGGFFIYDIKIMSTLAYIALMIFSVIIAVELHFINEETK